MMLSDCFTPIHVLYKHSLIVYVAENRQATLQWQKIPVTLISACRMPISGKSIITTFIQGWEQCLAIFHHGNGRFSVNARQLFRTIQLVYRRGFFA